MVITVCADALNSRPKTALLVPIGDLGNLRRQREDDIGVFHGQQVFGARRHPVARGGSLAFRAVPVLAGVARDVMVAAFGARGNMPAERFGSAGFNRGHHFELGQADMPGVGPPPRRAKGAEDVSDLQPKPSHRPRRLFQPSSQGLVL